MQYKWVNRPSSVRLNPARREVEGQIPMLGKPRACTYNKISFQPRRAWLLIAPAIRREQRDGWRVTFDLLN